MSHLDIRCSACGGLYTLITTELNILVLFQCSKCGQNNAYAAGHVILLDQDIMSEGTEVEKQQHVLEMVQQMAFEFAQDVLGNLDTILNINAKIDVPGAGDHIEASSGWKVETDEKSCEPGLLPSIKSEDASEISEEEVRDFVNIDLRLIDDKRHFEKVFGGNRK